MRVASLLPAFLVILVALSGCLNGDEPRVPAPGPGDSDFNPFDDPRDEEPAAPDEDEGAEPQDNSTAPEKTEQNSPPEAAITASTNAGTAPLTVTFSLRGSDADGDNLTWALDADADGVADAEGTELPSNFTITYGNVGSYLAELVVSDGKSSSRAGTEIVVTEADAGPPASITMTGSAFGIYAPVVGYSHIENPHEFTMPSGVKGITVTVSWEPPTILDLDLAVLDGSGSEVASSAEYNDAVQGDGSTSEAVAYTPGGLLAGGTWTVVVYEAEAFGGDYTVLVEFAT